MKILMEGTVEFFRPHFIEISKINWSECEDVVDDSPYIIAIGEDIKTTFPHIHQYLVESKFNLYRDSFSQLMIKEFETQIFSIKNVNDKGAEQLQIDTSSFAGFLLELPQLVDQTPSNSYRSRIQRSCENIKKTLKLVFVQLESIVEKFKSNFQDPEQNIEYLLRALDLKGVKKSSQEIYLDALGVSQDDPIRKKLKQEATSSESGPSIIDFLFRNKH